MNSTSFNETERILFPRNVFNSASKKVCGFRHVS